ncbi:MAG: 4-hydroxy-3-methylbut-2-enyl diphosphate reductase [Bacteroidia bacterium]|nr:MAG: 4-hydroxy-3-methylbut-2-enyl diphosphate reductase [Bacteroidia bacterium]
MKIEIDSNSGFCFGVVKAIKVAEEELKKEKKLYCLGDIVHNDAEVKRLEQLGLITINHNQFKELKNAKVLLRAHGEPPETYRIAQNNNIELIDASCPIVLNLQKKIDHSFKQISPIDGQLVIFGKPGHAEVVGLLGHTDNKGIVISSEEDLNKIDFKKPVHIFSQTTKSPKEYFSLINEIKKRMKTAQNTEQIHFVGNDTICRQVSNRDVLLEQFAQNYEIIIFVSGKKSSNGKVLYNVCKARNKRTYFVSEAEDLQKNWFTDVSSVGICGATSTPAWLMQKIKEAISNM